MRNQRFKQILTELQFLHDSKDQDYVAGGKEYDNIRGAEEWDVEAWKGAMIRANDKFKRLKTYAKTGKLNHESVVDSFNDLAIYAIIARILWEEVNPTRVVDITPDQAERLNNELHEARNDIRDLWMPRGKGVW